MSDLIQKLQSADGPSRELDAEIWEHFGYRVKRFKAGGGDRFIAYPPTGPEVVRPAKQALTASLDAALALVMERDPAGLPGFLREAMSDLAKEHGVHVRRWDRETDGNYTEKLARYVVAVLLRAIEGGEDG